jgi:uncharacterized protein (TIRG00374 family)
MEAVLSGRSDTPARTFPRAAVLRGALVVVSLAVLAFVVRAALPELRAAREALGGAHLGPLALALAAEVAAVVVLPQAYRAALRAFGGRARYGQALRASMGAFTISRVVPAGGPVGGVFAARTLRASGNRGTVAAAAVTLQGVGTMAVLLLLLALGAAVAAPFGGVPRSYLGFALALAVCWGALALACVLALRSPGFRGSLERALARVTGRAQAGRLRAALDDLALLPLGARRLAPVGGWSAATWLLDLAALWLAFAAFGQALSAGLLLVGYIVVTMLMGIPTTPGGLGVVEAGTAAAYVALGIPAAAAISAVLCYRLVSYWMPTLAGIPQYLRNASAKGLGTE